MLKMGNLIGINEGTDWIMQEGVLPFFVEQEILKRFTFIDIIPRREATIGPEGKGTFPICITEDDQEKWDSNNPMDSEAGDDTDAVQTFFEGENWTVGNTKKTLLDFDYTTMLRNNDPAGRIPKQSRRNAIKLATILDKDITTTTFANAQGNGGTYTLAEFNDNPIQIMELMKDTMKDNTGGIYIPTDIILSKERYTDYIKKAYDPQYHMAFSRVFGISSEIVVDDDGQSLPLRIRKGNFTTAATNKDYILCDREDSWGAVYSNLSAYSLSENLQVPLSVDAEMGEYPIGAAWEEPKYNTPLMMRTNILMDNGFGMISPQSVDAKLFTV
jgi:hypothetical protein